ncbi:MAG: RnfABCDGE type electron transport complex subunit D [Oscillospiraceae bacterium]|jgi:electron transport complex protein RnfD|nr:RnfABCDGE type electron transport complex subunit D [Oscillospiraceae bacterium]
MEEALPRWKKLLRDNREARRWNLVSLELTLPLLVVGYYYYGAAVPRLAVIAALAAMICEAVAGRLVLRRRTVDDWNAAVVGVWVACMLPAGSPPWLAVVGAAFAILVVKIPFGGTLSAPFIPAAAGFAFLTVCFPARVFAYVPSVLVDPVDYRSLASLLRGGQFVPHVRNISYVLLGQTVGPMGTGSLIVIAAVLLISFLLKGRRTAALASLSFLAAAALLAFAFPRIAGSRLDSVWMELCSGSLAFAAVFLLPDPATLPRRWFTRAGYGAMAGVLAMLLRYLGSYEESACFALLLANAAMPLLIRAKNEIAHLKVALAQKKQREGVA